MWSLEYMCMCNTYILFWYLSLGRMVIHSTKYGKLLNTSALNKILWMKKDTFWSVLKVLNFGLLVWSNNHAYSINVILEEVFENTAENIETGRQCSMWWLRSFAVFEFGYRMWTRTSYSCSLYDKSTCLVVIMWLQTEHLNLVIDLKYSVVSLLFAFEFPSIRQLNVYSMYVLVVCITATCLSYLWHLLTGCNYLLLAICFDWCSGRMLFTSSSL